jgi:branched-chain amino acid transport system substrate-binding protein
MNVRRGLSVAIAATVLAAACSGGTSSGQTYKIGYDSSQTGTLAYSDVPASKGVQLAIDEINAKGGIDGKYKIELTLQDNRSEAAQSAVVAQDLLSKGVQFLICTSDADPCTAAGQVAQGKGIPTMSTAATSPVLPGSVGDFMFMSVFGDNVQTAALAEYAAEQGYKNAYLLCSPDSSYTSKSCDYFKYAFEKLGGAVAGQGSFTLGAADFAAEVTKIKNLSPAPDVIMTPAYPPDAPTFIKQLRAAGVETPVLSIDGVDSVDTISAGGPAVEGLTFTTHGFPVPGSSMEKFWTDYKTKNGSDPESVFAATGYDLVKIIEAAVLKAGSTDPKKVRDAIDVLENVQGATGSITYKDQNRIPLKEVYLVTVKDGKFAFVKKIKPDPAHIATP